MICVAITSVRGGTGKSTLAVNLAASLADLGDTLLVDLDAKSDCASGLAVPHEAIRAGSQEILTGRAERRRLRREALAWPVQKQLDLVPSKPTQGFGGDGGIPEGHGDPGHLVLWIKRCRRRYQFVVLDVPTGDHHTLRQALEIATTVLVPAVPDFPSLAASQRDLDGMEQLVAAAGRDIPVRMVGNMHDVRSRFSREMIQGFRRRLQDRFLRTVVRSSVKVREAASFGQPVKVYDRNCSAADDYANLANELGGRKAGADSGDLQSVHPRLKYVDVDSGQVAIPLRGVPDDLLPPLPRPRTRGPNGRKMPIRLPVPARSLQLVHDGDK